MMLNGGSPFVEAYSNNERLIFLFDTGSFSFLSNSFYQKHAADSIDAGRNRTITSISGFGGTKESGTFSLPSFPLKVGTVNRNMTDLRVLTDRLGDGPSRNDGVLGGDFVRMFRKVTVNFNKMFLTVE